MTQDYKYKVSVIMPLYNIEGYLEEAVDSIISQTMGFEDNIQLIFVNDGSPDNLDLICKKYKEQYPKNIIYLEKENGGVSSARNAGIPSIEGKYVNFFDGDDKWDKEAFSNIYSFFEKNFNQIDIVAGRYCYFEGKEGFEHPLDYKFGKTHIVDIHKEFDHVQLSTATVFLKASALKDYKFDTRLRFSEDSIFLSKLLLEKEKYGVVREAVYYYRKRINEDSAINTMTSSPAWYFDTPKYCYKNLFQYSKEKYGTVIPYIQYLVMYDLQWRLGTVMPLSFSEEDRNWYKDCLTGLLKEIDDKIIAQQRSLNFVYKIFALSLKYETDILQDVNLNGWKIQYKGTHLFSLRAKYRLYLTNMQIRDGILHIEGSYQLGYLGEAYSLQVQDDHGKEYAPAFYPVLQKDRYAFSGEKLLTGTGFRLKIPVQEVSWVEFALIKKNGEKIVLSPSFGRFAKIDKEQKSTYYAHKNFLVKYRNNKIKIIPRTKKRLLASEMRYLKNSVLKDRKWKVACYRAMALLGKAFSRKDIWLVSDRTDMARDNGEALFAYLMKQKTQNKKIFFAIDKSSVDYPRMKALGSVLRIGSMRYKLYFLRAEKIISAHADDWVINAFGEDKSYFGDLYDFDYIFLQHGIIKDDLSDWLHKFKKNIHIFVTSAKEEYNSIIFGDYGYTENEVKLTGLPRFDKLTSEAERKIVFLPTWRKEIANPVIKGTSIREYSEKFKKSRYFEFFNGLINDNRILEVLKKCGYTGEFYVHPAFSSQIKDFEGNEVIKVADEEADYQKLFRENMLMVTDFSSVAFDFAYMKKPIIYSQFDHDTFFAGHSYDKGYFEYERDGFGPVCYNYEDTVAAIIQSVKNGCKMETQYIERVNQFFAWKDKNNCERVYRAILDMDNM
ncbi:CDP-glycerol glycerophosphotransferase family protein [Anaerovorax odorimutans]|uniref:CDP-glycerol glycerophosphotransferase family protein n=1 Tax=Anaerovorax odorimutans TaxID=109327 RepID=A0ABT1RJB5_9FIRM|nr:CDP-glycerol glycerophosphotransferase family protein [Anaerovorax odorimutans]MCQ4635275.1 CDP-glycerol glycerophosphotransferase family protein [Anaerovorax odorimutans]